MSPPGEVLTSSESQRLVPRAGLRQERAKNAGRRERGRKDPLCLAEAAWCQVHTEELLRNPRGSFSHIKPHFLLFCLQSSLTHSSATILQLTSGEWSRDP